MTANNIEKTVKEIISEYLGIDTSSVKKESYLMRDLGLDSLGLAEIAFEIEEKFKVKISENTINKIKIVKDIVNYIVIQKKIKRKD